METKIYLNEPCYVTNHNCRSIETTLNIGEHVIGINQRRLTGAEKEDYKNNLKDTYTDPDIYKYLLKQDDIDKQLARAKKKAKKDEPITIEPDEETKYIVFKGRRSIENHNRNVQALLISHSCNDSLSFGGYFKVDGIEVDNKTKMRWIKELTEDEETGVDNFDVLLKNAERLMTPTKQDKDNAKS